MRGLAVLLLLASAGLARADYQQDRAAYDQCLSGRAVALRDAQQIADLHERARVLSSIPSCGDAPPAPPSEGQPVLSPLTYDEDMLLRRGEISERTRAAGIEANFLGFGLGHVVQGRWLDTGWIFTVGELATGSMLVYGVREELKWSGDPNGATYAWIGGVGYFLFRLASGYDVREGPRRHNERIANLRARRDKARRDQAPRIIPQVSAGERGASAGLFMRF